MFPTLSVFIGPRDIGFTSDYREIHQARNRLAAQAGPYCEAESPLASEPIIYSFPFPGRRCRSGPQYSQRLCTWR